MDSELISQVTEDIVGRVFEQNKDFIFKELAHGLEGKKPGDALLLASYNALRVSTNLSVQIVLTMLIEKGILALPTDCPNPQLTVIRGKVDRDPSGER